MSYQALARKWRPKTFSQVIGQGHVVTALSNALDSQRIHHAYLFTGTRGVGKTTLARIFAKALNCETGISATPCGECVSCQSIDQGNFVDLIEVDAASRTKVDDTRELLDNVQYTPTQGRVKIYLIDEVHMLSTHSFNALLKTLEEPPEHVKFLLATTDPQKLPATILSRCIQFNLKSMDLEELSQQLGHILDAEQIPFETEAVNILSRSAQGSVRDALSLLDQAIAYGNGQVNTDQVRTMLGMIDNQFIVQLILAIMQANAGQALNVVADMSTRSVDFSAALDELLSTLHNIALIQVDPSIVEWKGIDIESLQVVSEQIAPDELQLLYQITAMGKRDLPFASDLRSGFEMLVLRLLAFQPSDSDGARRNGGGSSKAAPGVIRRPAKSASDVESSQNVQSHIEENPKASAVTAASDGSSDVPSHGSIDGLATGSNTGIEQDAEPVAAPLTADESARLAQSLESTSSFNVNELESPEAWRSFVDSCGIQGMAREMMMHMLPTGAKGTGVMGFALDTEFAHLNQPDRVRKIATIISNRTGSRCDLEIEVIDQSSVDGETPSMQVKREKAEELASAQDSFQQDANVQELVKLFDGEVVVESIKPSAG